MTTMRVVPTAPGEFGVEVEEGHQISGHKIRLPAAFPDDLLLTDADQHLTVRETFDFLLRLGVAAEEVEVVARAEVEVLARRERAYRGDRPPVAVAGATVIVVDDGLATGASMRAALQALRALRPAAIVAAVPVGSPETCRT